MQNKRNPYRFQLTFDELDDRECFAADLLLSVTPKKRARFLTMAVMEYAAAHGLIDAGMSLPKVSDKPLAAWGRSSRAAPGAPPENGHNAANTVAVPSGYTDLEPAGAVLDTAEAVPEVVEEDFDFLDDDAFTFIEEFEGNL